VEVEAMVDALAGLDPDCDDGVRVDRIAALERLQAAVFAAQAAELVRFADSQEAEQHRLGVPARRVGVGVADQVALACRVSPVTGARRVGLARTLVRQLPSTYALLARGEISAGVATVVARETDALTPHDRAVVDAQLAGRLAALSPREVEAATRRTAISVDPASAVRRGQTARANRRVTIRPAPDTMALVSGFVPVEQGVAAWASLDRDARTRRAAGDLRSLSQLRADTFIERLIGHTPAAAVPVEIGLTLPADALLGEHARDESPAPAGSAVATLPGYGPIPAAFARDLAGTGTNSAAAEIGAHAAGQAAVWSGGVGSGGGADRARVFIRRILTDPIDHTVVAVDTRRRRFDGALARYLIACDQHCRIPYCTAPIRHLDHITPWRDDGPTSATTGKASANATPTPKKPPAGTSGSCSRRHQPRAPPRTRPRRPTPRPDPTPPSSAPPPATPTNPKHHPPTAEGADVTESATCWAHLRPFRSPPEQVWQRLLQTTPPRGELVPTPMLEMDEVETGGVGALPQVPVGRQQVGKLGAAGLHPQPQVCGCEDFVDDVAPRHLYVVARPPQCGRACRDGAEQVGPAVRDVQRRVATQAVPEYDTPRPVR
jgi:hypothetical protein